jgi:predicted nucleic-acid-binding protein
LLRDDERLYQRTREFFRRVKDGDDGAYFPDAVIAECIYVLEKRYAVEREQIAIHLLDLVSLRGVDAQNRALLQVALGLYRSHRVDFVDALVAATARIRGWGVQSFDRDLQRLSR